MMDLPRSSVRDALEQVDVEGWDGAAARALLQLIRLRVVVPAVRASGLSGPAADQAEASGWAAAWDALRRPSARTAENPGGMVWVAVRRAVWGEVRVAGRARGAAASSGSESADMGLLSLDQLADAGWQWADTPSRPQLASGLHRRLLAGLVEAGWNRRDAADSIALLADQVEARAPGAPVARWRWVALRLAIPEWRARRLATLLLGVDDVPGVVRLATQHGLEVFDDEAVQAALGATTCRWSASPEEWLAQVGSGDAMRVPA